MQPLLSQSSHFTFFFFLMIRRPPRSTHCISSAASDVYKRQVSTQSTWDNIEPVHPKNLQVKFLRPVSAIATKTPFILKKQRIFEKNQTPVNGQHNLSTSNSRTTSQEKKTKVYYNPDTSNSSFNAPNKFAKNSSIAYPNQYENRSITYETNNDSLIYDAESVRRGTAKYKTRNKNKMKPEQLIVKEKYASLQKLISIQKFHNLKQCHPPKKAQERKIYLKIIRKIIMKSCKIWKKKERTKSNILQCSKSQEIVTLQIQTFQVQNPQTRKTRTTNLKMKQN
eukprot:TRINITY_DN25286_c0_g1_i1.p1 TRINITY_DN25286_c0_g1~~TRINITY_DN25286_c0_g1_i1.p1  ORF type:complete len:281 (-),score=67.03 TRINITY_DN25286_c0_g1_i1:106-948(-)